MGKKECLKNFRRFLIYLLGIIILAFGITLNTKTMLGVSPIIAIPYNISVIWEIPLGVTTFSFYIVLILLQLLLLRREFQPYQLLQVFVSLITSACIQIYDQLLPVAAGIAGKGLMLAGAIVFTGIGAALMVGMRLVPNPAEGMADVIGRKLKRGLGFGKNVFDFVSLLIAVCMGLIFGGHIIGIGLGTVCSMIFIGRVIAVCQKTVGSIYQKVCGG